jgi:penicillin-binding protein-related factor A (putative recombinase)
MKAKEFEEVCLYRLRQHEERGEATVSRYGVQGSFINGEWQPIQSLPDFEGVLPPNGQQFVFDCKVSGQPSFPLDDDKFKRRQFRHMVTRARFGAVCFLLIHFTARELKRSTEAAQTWAFPVRLDHPLWAAFDRGETKRITRADCEEYAVPVEWNTLPGGRANRPDVLAAIVKLAASA